MRMRSISRRGRTLQKSLTRKGIISSKALANLRQRIYRIKSLFELNYWKFYNGYKGKNKKSNITHSGMSFERDTFVRFLYCRGKSVCFIFSIAIVRYSFLYHTWDSSVFTETVLTQTGPHLWKTLKER